MTQALSLTRASESAPATNLAIVVATELVAAAFLRQFLLAEDWRLVVALLLVFSIALIALQRWPAIEARIEEAFTHRRGAASILGIVLVFAFPLALQQNTYAIHLCIVAQLYAVLALALNFQLGSANIPNFATGASYGIGAYASALLGAQLGRQLLAGAAGRGRGGDDLRLPARPTVDAHA